MLGTGESLKKERLEPKKLSVRLRDVSHHVMLRMTAHRVLCSFLSKSPVPSTSDLLGDFLFIKSNVSNFVSQAMPIAYISTG